MHKHTKVILGLLLAVAVLAAPLTVALADGTVVATGGGAPTVSNDPDLNFGSFAFSTSPQESAAWVPFSVTVTDPSFAGTGWSLSFNAAAFTPAGGTILLIHNGPTTCTRTSGTGGTCTAPSPWNNPGAVTFGTPAKFVSYAAGDATYGVWTVNQSFKVNLTAVPPATYSSVWTVTITATP